MEASFLIRELAVYSVYKIRVYSLLGSAGHKRLKLPLHTPLISRGVAGGIFPLLVILGNL